MVLMVESMSVFGGNQDLEDGLTGYRWGSLRATFLNLPMAGHGTILKVSTQVGGVGDERGREEGKRRKNSGRG